MAVRNKRRRCRNCPEEANALPPPQPQPAATTPTFGSESSRLWQFSLYACNTALELMYGFAVMDVPGDPVPSLKRLHTRLGEIIQLREERTREDSGSTE